MRQDDDAWRFVSYTPIYTCAADWYFIPPFFHCLRTLNPLRVDVLEKLYKQEPHPTFTRSHMEDLDALGAWQAEQLKDAEEQVASSKVYCGEPSSLSSISSHICVASNTPYAEYYRQLLLASKRNWMS